MIDELNKLPNNDDLIDAKKENKYSKGDDKKNTEKPNNLLKHSEFYIELLKSMRLYGYNPEIEFIQAMQGKKEIRRDVSALKKAVQNYGFDCKDVLGNGNCFLYAVVDQLNEHLNLGLSDQQIKKLGENLREFILEHIQKNMEVYEPYIYDLEPDAFIEENSKNGVWLDDLMITALLYSLNVNIIIIRDDDAPPLLKNFRIRYVYSILGIRLGIITSRLFRMISQIYLKNFK